MHIHSSIQEGYAGITHIPAAGGMSLSNTPSQVTCLQAQVLASLYQKLLNSEICGPSIVLGIKKLPPIMPNVLNQFLIVKATKEILCLIIHQSGIEAVSFCNF
jgi:hypothetical protein